VDDKDCEGLVLVGIVALWLRQLKKTFDILIIVDTNPWTDTAKSLLPSALRTSYRGEMGQSNTMCANPNIDNIWSQ